MKVFIHYDITNRPWGGGNSFLRALRREFLEHKEYGIDIVSRINEPCDIFLMNGGHRAPGRLIKPQEIENIKKWGYQHLLAYMWHRFKIQHKKIILRLDGARKMYANHDDKMYANHDDKMYSVQQECIRLADHIIFQSTFSLGTFKDAHFDPNAFSIIYNGVDQKIFSLPQKKRNSRTPIKIISGSWSSNPMKGHMKIASFSELPGVTVTFVGNWPREIQKKNVIVIAPQRQELLAQTFHKHDLFLFPSKNEACSNIVLEALSCGLPLLYEDSGGTKEIALGYGRALTGNNTDDIAYMKEHYSEFQDAILRDREKFSISHVASLYANVFRAALINRQEYGIG